MSILVEHTRQKHREVEEHPLVQLMINGEITKPQYVLFLKQFYYVYSAIEYYAEMAGLLNDLIDIKRAEYIKEDLKELGCSESELINVQQLPSVKTYVNHIRDLYYGKDMKKVLAHVYVRHMGDMYGGKLIARQVPGSGRCYQFIDKSAVVRALNNKLTLDLVDEALFAFDCSASVFDDLMESFNE